MWPMQKYLWVVFISIGICQTRAATLRCYLSSLADYITVTLNNSTSLLNSTCMNSSLLSEFYTHGYEGKSDGPATTSVLDAFITDIVKRNVILLNWEVEASSGNLGASLGYALSGVPNAKKVGDDFGNALVNLIKDGLNISLVHLMGHSQGAHVMAFAARIVQANGYTIPRLTGLDPAKPFYEPPLATQQGIDQNDADFVDIIHTDPSHYGYDIAAGTVDFWPNKAAGVTLQPGCPLGVYKMLSPNDKCSHDRSWMLYLESLLAPTSLVGVYANNFASWAAGNYNKSNTAYMGQYVSTSARGNYFLTTNSVKPYGRGEDGIYPRPDQTITAV